MRPIFQISLQNNCLLPCIFSLVLYLLSLSSFALSESDQLLLKKHAPIIVHQVGYRPAYDDLRRIDFDGDFNTRNNVKNGNVAMNLGYAIYGQVLAETSDAFYLLYAMYHLRDYDTKLREYFISSAAHDNDLEGLVLMVSKTDGPLAMETWYHSLFLQFITEKRRLESSELIDGKLQLENGDRPYVWIQSLGHGVRAMQSLDATSEEFSQSKLYRFKDDLSPARDHSYELLDFSLYLKKALENKDPDLFEEFKPALGGVVQLPVYFAGTFKGNNRWARPKPPWNWNSKVEPIVGGMFYFHPAMMFEHHFGLGLSTTYVRNEALKQVFDLKNPNSGLAKNPPIEWFLKKGKTSLPKKPESAFDWWWINVKRKFSRLTQELFFRFS